MKGEQLTVSLLLGWTVCGITAMLVGMTVPAVVILGTSLVSIVSYQIWYESKY
jgi:hypothetical protein